jgi:predicted CxxxxCH...CXXCH cytochrome family protein
LLDNKCSNIGCHVSGAPQGSLATYEDAVAFVGVGKILGALRNEEGFVAMPKNGDMLSACEIEKIEAWIEDGTPE